MKRPAKVKIIGKTYRVEWPESIEHEGGYVDGLHDPESLVIQVADKQPLEKEQDALLHEVMHGIETAFDLDLDDTIIQRLSTGLLAVLKDNPQFVTYLRRRGA